MHRRVGAAAEDLVEQDRQLLETERSSGFEAPCRPSAVEGVVEPAPLRRERKLGQSQGTRDGVKVAGRGTVALDELGRRFVASCGDLCLVRKLEIGTSHPRREVVDDRRRAPRVGGQALFAGTQVRVLVREQQAALDKVGDA
jgi:hypothetical protein